jgi:hypothetical protein
MLICDERISRSPSCNYLDGGTQTLMFVGRKLGRDAPVRSKQFYNFGLLVVNGPIQGRLPSLQARICEHGHRITSQKVYIYVHVYMC